jgi:hypothetical protein
VGRRAWLSALACLLVALPLGYAGWRTYFAPGAEQCYGCMRAVHAHSKTIALVNGHPKVFCCPACALSWRARPGETFRITRLTSFLTGQTLSADSAYVVKGSDTATCEPPRELIGSDQRPASVAYDRCSPSLIAFAKRTEAADFARQHGGQVAAFHDLEAVTAR